MSSLCIKRQHTMAPDKLKSEVEALAEKLVDKFGGSYQWEGDKIRYAYSGGVKASVACTPKDVQVDVELGMMMSMLKGKIKSEVEGYLDKHIT